MSDPLAKFRQFRPAGPVSAAFLADATSKVRGLLGPVGGGKTVSCIFDCLKNASHMPLCSDGVIRYRVAIIGSTYGQLERNLYPSWTDWIPRDGGEWSDGEWTGGGGRFAQHKLAFDTIRGDRRVEVRFEAIFAAIGEQSVEQFMRGFEPTAFWLYEMDQLPSAVLTNAIGRIGRYPRAELLPFWKDRDGKQIVDAQGNALRVPFRRYVIGDLNAPDIDSWFYKTFEEDRPEGFALYKQPSGRSPQAENLANLPPGYYDDQVALNVSKPRWVRRFVDAQYGPSDEGEPVYPEFDDRVHVSAERIPYDPSRDVYLGLDQGLTRPAGVILQRAASGQWRALQEVVPGRMSAKRFADQMRQVLAERCPKAKIAGAWADPAGFTGADKEDGELAWAETVGRELGITILPTETNEIDPRLTAVKDELTFMIAPNVPGIILSAGDCPMLRKGFASHYRYRRQRIGNTEQFSDKPEKNDYSNPHDALQYGLLGVKGRSGVISGDRGSGKGREWAQGGNQVGSSSFIDAGRF